MGDSNVEFNQAHNEYDLLLTWEGRDDVAEVTFPGGGGAEIWQESDAHKRSLRLRSPVGGVASGVILLGDFLYSLQQAVVSLRRPDESWAVDSGTVSTVWIPGEVPKIEILAPEGNIALVELDPDGLALVSVMAATPAVGHRPLVATQLMLALWEASVALDTTSTFRDLDKVADGFS